MKCGGNLSMAKSARKGLSKYRKPEVSTPWATRRELAAIDSIYWSMRITFMLIYFSHMNRLYLSVNGNNQLICWCKKWIVLLTYQMNLISCKSHTTCSPSLLKVIRLPIHIWMCWKAAWCQWVNKTFVNLPCTVPSSQQAATYSHISETLLITTYSSTSSQHGGNIGSGGQHAILHKRSFTHLERFIMQAPRPSGETMPWKTNKIMFGW